VIEFKKAFALTTTSPMVSVAFFTTDGNSSWTGNSWAPQSATSACMQLCLSARQEGYDIRDCDLFCADLGPGSFTGIRVGMMIVKAFAFAAKGLCCGALSFDLVDPKRDVVVPSKKGEWWHRSLGTEPTRVHVMPGGAIGWGNGIENPYYPSAIEFSNLMSSLNSVSPEELFPQYFGEPSISQPKNRSVILPPSG